MWEKSKRDTEALTTSQLTIDELRTKALEDHTRFSFHIVKNVITKLVCVCVCMCVCV